MKDLTTVTVERETSQRLASLKVHKRQGVDEIIRMLLDNYESKQNHYKAAPKSATTTLPLFSGHHFSTLIPSHSNFWSAC